MSIEESSLFYDLNEEVMQEILGFLFIIVQHPKEIHEHTLAVSAIQLCTSLLISLIDQGNQSLISQLLI